MKITVTPTNDQIAAALASVWGCEPSDVGYHVEKLRESDITIDTDVKGVVKAERAISKITKAASE